MLPAPLTINVGRRNRARAGSAPLIPYKHGYRSYVFRVKHRLNNKNRVLLLIFVCYRFCYELVGSSVM